MTSLRRLLARRPWLVGALVVAAAVVVVLLPVTHALLQHPHQQGGMGQPPGQAAPPAPGSGPQAATASVTTGLIGYLTIPRLGLQHVAIADRGLDAAHDMVIAPGFTVTHYSLSGPLGGTSNAVLYGHDDIEGSVFRALDSLAPGDTVIVDLRSGGELTYMVTSRQIVGPRDIAVLDSSVAPLLTIFTCYPLDVDTRRVIITAVPSR